MKLKYIIYIICFCLISPRLMSQVSTHKRIMSNQYEVSKIENIPIFQLPTLNNDSLNRCHNGENHINTTNKFIGIEIKKTVDLTQGKWERLNNNDFIWRIRIQSPTALGFQFKFNQFYLPPSAYMHIYNREKTDIYGAYTFKNNLRTHRFSTQTIPYGDVIIELYIKKEDIKDLEFQMRSVAHMFSGYTKRRSEGLNMDAVQSTILPNCHNHVNCSP